MALVRTGCGRFLVAALVVVLSGSTARAQSLHGKISDDHSSPLGNVNVILRALSLQVSSTAEGAYEIRDLPSGTYTVEYHAIGYETETRSVQVTGDDVPVDVVLRASPLEMPAVTVTAKPQPSGIGSSAQPVSVIEGRELARGRGESIGQTIESMPGVSTFSRGPLSSKPVIRGLTAHRVVIAIDGTRHESQQWDDEQSPEIDGLDADRIEILRGPASVLFGSDALGGIVNVITQDSRTSEEMNGSPLAGVLTLDGFTNNRAGSGSLSLSGIRDAFDYRGQFSARGTGDIMTPAGSLFNSGGSEINGGASVGLQQNWGTAGIRYSHFGQKLEISPDPEELASQPDLAPRQEITHDRILASLSTPFSGSRLELHGSWQQGERSEFEDAEKEGAEEKDTAGVKLRLSTIALDAKLHHAPVGPLKGTVGLSLMSQKNETLGLDPLIPAFTQTSYGAFVYEEYPLAPVAFSAGIRVDGRRLEVDRNDDLGVLSQTRDYSAVTGTGGLVWNLDEEFSIAMSIGRGWRAPIAAELFSSGPDQEAGKFIVGRADFDPEESLDLDLTARAASPRFGGEFSVFNNRIQHYIFLRPTTAVDAGSGLPVYAADQADANLSGTEIDVHGVVTDALIIHGGFDMVIGKNLETGTWLPLIPAHRVKGGIRVALGPLGPIQRPFVTLDGKAVLDQERVDPLETRTGGYSLFAFGVGGEFAAGSRTVAVDLSVDNMFDRAYADHLSRYKEYALNPGRNFILHLGIPFTVPLSGGNAKP